MGWVYNASDAIAAQSRYPTIAAVCVVLSALSTFVVCTRIGMHWKAGHIAPDDYFAGISMVRRCVTFQSFSLMRCQVFGIIYSALCITREQHRVPTPGSSTADSIIRDKIWSGAATQAATQSQSRHLHQGQLRRAAVLSARHSRLQDCIMHQLSSLIVWLSP